MDDDSTNFLKTVSLCRVCCVHVRVCFQANLFGSVLFWCRLYCSSLMSGWVCHWKPFWIPDGDSWKKALMEEWVFISDEHTDEQAPIDDPVFQSTDYSDCIPGTTRISKQCDPVPCEATTPRDKPHFWERLEAPLRPRPKCNFIHPQQHSPFPERLKLPFSIDAILSGYEDIVFSGSDHFTMWGKIRPLEVLAGHVVDIHKVMADFREAYERRQASSSQTYGVDTYFLLNITCAEEAQNLQLEPWAPTWEGRRI